MLSLSKTLRELRERGLENTFQRFYSNYQATMTNAKDSAQIGRGRVLLSSLGYSEEAPGFADVLTPYGGEDYGFYFPAYENDSVYVSFDHGDPSSPMIVGGAWRTRNQKLPADSDLPYEFIQTDGSAPVVRGIKVKSGSALIFNETPGKTKVEMWSGASQGRGKAATQHHKVLLDDTTGEEKVVVTSFGGHSTTWQDKAGEVFVRTVTADGHEIFLDDTGRKIFIKTKDGHQATFSDADKVIEVLSAGLSSITIDDNDNSVALSTVGGNSVTLNDTLSKIEALTAGGRKFTMDDVTKVIRLLSPTPAQTVEISPTTGTSITDASPGGVSVIASAGPLTAVAQGTNITSANGQIASMTNTGSTLNTFTGPKLETLLGGETKTITGAWTLLGAFIATINATSVLLGSGVQFRLVNELFLTAAYNVHFHISGTPGTPTSVPVVGIGVPGTHTTIQTTAS